MADNEMPSQDDLASQLIELVERRLLDPLEILLESAADLTEIRDRVVQRAEAWSSTLLGADDDTARFLGIRLMVTLYPSDQPFDPPAGWWETALGRVMVRRVGHPSTDHVSYGIAGKMLGVSRQGVHDLVVRGKLDRHDTAGVTTESIQRRIAALDAGETRSVRKGTRSDG